VTAAAALRHFWRTDDFDQDISRRSKLLGDRLRQIAGAYPEHMSVKGRGMMQGIDVGSGELASVITGMAFEKGVIIETSGAHDEVVKVLAPLTIDDDVFAAGLDIVEQSVRAAMAPAIGIAAE
jgi:diaminobutyrate-2-oxoglutarate transaminase